MQVVAPTPTFASSPSRGQTVLWKFGMSVRCTWCCVVPGALLHDLWYRPRDLSLWASWHTQYSARVATLLNYHYAHVDLSHPLATPSERTIYTNIPSRLLLQRSCGLLRSAIYSSFRLSLNFNCISLTRTRSLQHFIFLCALSCSKSTTWLEHCLVYFGIYRHLEKRSVEECYFYELLQDPVALTLAVGIAQDLLILHLYFYLCCWAWFVTVNNNILGL